MKRFTMKLRNRNYETETQTMKQHTIAQVAKSGNVSKRTVQNWVKQATADHGSIGTLAGNARVFTDYEKAILLSYASGSRVSAKTMKPTYETMKLHSETFHSETTKLHSETTKPTYETTPVEFVDTQLTPAPLAVVPSSFDLSTLRGGSLAAPTPLALANDAVEKMAALRAAMQADMDRQEAHLQQQRLTAQMLDQETARLKDTADEFRRKSEMNALRDELLQAQQAAALGKLQGYAQGS
jgi:DNA-binding transcriptional MerR regulator